MTGVEKKVHIIGAGPAGCAAAARLVHAGTRVTLYEKHDRAGGLSRTLERNGARYDIGPHRFFTRAPRVMQFWQDEGKDILQSVPRCTRILYGSHRVDYPLSPVNAACALGFGKSTAAAFSYAAMRTKLLFHSPPNTSFEEWVIHAFGRVMYECFFKTYTEKIWGIPCSEIDVRWAAQRIRGLNLPRAVLNALTGHRFSRVKTLVTHFLYPQGGAGNLYSKSIQSLEKAITHVAYQHDIISVHHNGTDRITAVTWQKPDGSTGTDTIDTLISTMPLTHLVSRMMPQPPEEVLTAARALRYRTHISVNLLLSKSPFPDNWMYVHTPSVAMGRIANYRNFSHEMCPDKNRTPITCEYFAFPGDALDNCTDAVLIDRAVKECRSLNIFSSAAPEDAFVVRNPQAYCVIERGFETHRTCIRKYIDAFSNLYTAGRAGMFKYNNQDHSIMTALLVADNVLGASTDPWAVNNDAEYHESGTAPDICDEDREESAARDTVLQKKQQTE